MLAADTFVDTVVVILSISPVIFLLSLCKKYNPEEIPEFEPLL